MNLENLFKKLTSKFDSKLCKTTALKELPKEFQEFISRLYQEKHLSTRLFGTLLNAIFSDERTELHYEFLMSKNLMVQLVEQDHKVGNLERQTLNWEEYNTFAALLINREIIKVIESSEVRSDENPNGIAGTWKLIDRDARKLIERNLNNGLDEDGLPYMDEEDRIAQYQHHADYAQWLDQQIAMEKIKENADHAASPAEQHDAPETNKTTPVSKPLKFY